MRTLVLAALALSLSPLTPTGDVDPCEELAQLVPALLDTGDRFGYSVAAEGDRLVVGAPNHDEQTGAVFVYSFDGREWNLDATILPSGAEVGDQFGYGVSLSGDLLAVSAPTDDTDGTDAGAVYVFEETSATVWTLDEKLLPSEPGDWFGESISLWGDTLAVGEWHNARVYVFRQSGSGWSQEGDEDGAPFDSPAWDDPSTIATSFGESVALYEDTLLVGDDNYTVPVGPSDGNSLGRAYVFTRDGSSWSLSQTIENPFALTDAEHFGEVVALHGRWAMIGAPHYDDGKEFQRGVVHVYKVDVEGQYIDQRTPLAGSDSDASDLFGKSLSIRSGVLVVGAPGKDVDSGAAYQFNLDGGAYVQVGIYAPLGLTADDKFGWSVAVGRFAGIGMPSDPTEGKAYTWSLCE